MAEEDEEDDKGTFANRRDEITKKNKKSKTKQWDEQESENVWGERVWWM